MSIDKYRNENAVDAYQLEDGTGVLLLESSTTTQDAAFAGDFGDIAAPIVVQYQALVGPVVQVPVAPFDPAVGPHVTFPDYLYRRTFSASQQDPFFNDALVFILPRLDWCPLVVMVDAPKDAMIPSGMDPSKVT